MNRKAIAIAVVRQRLASSPFATNARQQCHADESRGQDPRRSPAEPRSLDEREDQQADPARGAEGTRQIEAAVCVARPIAVQQDEGANQGDGDQWYVDQEDALPSECLGQNAAEQDTNDQAGRTGTRPY